jgi:DNA repair protein RadD
MHAPLPAIKPRPYQLEAVDALYQYFATHHDPTENPLIAMPTGSGKSLVIALFLKTIYEHWPSQRVMMLTHRKELIGQNAKQLKRFWPGAPVGIYSAGLKSKDSNQPITFAGIQSAIKNPQLFGHVDLLIIDEAHLVSPENGTSYEMFIAFLRARNPYLRIIGLSATIYRLGLGMLTEGGIFTDVAYDICSLQAFVKLLDDGYLCPLIPLKTETQLDVSNIHMKGGEFVEKELQERLAKEELTYQCLVEALQDARDRNHWLIFAIGIEHTEMCHSLLTEMGVSSTFVHSQLSNERRDEAIRQFVSGEVRVMVNAGILTTGFDYPSLDCIVLLRPTASPGLHVQILGRGTRPNYAPGFDLETREGRLAAIAASSKKNCLVLDFAGNTMRLGPINDPKLPKNKNNKGDKEKKGDVPVKVCPDCDCMNLISARICENCGSSFEIKGEEALTPVASTLELIVRDEPQTHWFNVTHVTYQAHHKPGSPPSLRVNYHCGLRRFSEWICLFHEGNPIQRKARIWWMERGNFEDLPRDIDEALDCVGDLRKPKQIKVWTNKKYPDIINYIF